MAIWDGLFGAKSKATVSPLDQITFPPARPPLTLQNPYIHLSAIQGAGLQNANSLQQGRFSAHLTKAMLAQQMAQIQALYGLDRILAPEERGSAHNAAWGLGVIANSLHLIPDQSQPDTLGYRAWYFDPDRECLVSPTQHTPWQEAELHCEEWNEDDVVRGVAGIHARLVPYAWQTAQTDYGAPGPSEPSRYSLGDGLCQRLPLVTGIVERFGRYVLGTEGWRAEWVMIRKLHAPNKAIAAALETIYPEVEITYGNR